MKASWLLYGFIGLCSLSHIHVGFPAGHILLVDEAFTWRVVSSPTLKEAIAITAADFHPPLYYILLWLWTSPWDLNETALRSFSGLCSIATVLAVFWYTSIWSDSSAKEKGGPLLASALVTFGVCQVVYAHIARMYALLGLLTVLCSIAWLLAIKRPLTWKWWLLGGILGTALVYTHNYGILYVGISACWVLFEGLRRGNTLVLVPRALVSFGIVVVLYLGWLPSLRQQLLHARAEHVVRPLDSHGLAAVPVQFVLPPMNQMPALPEYAVGLLFLATVALLFPWGGRSAEWQLAFLFGLHLVVLAIIPHALGHNVFVPRYLAHLLPLFASVVAVRTVTLSATLGPVVLYGVPALLACWLLWIVFAFTSTEPRTIQKLVSHVANHSRADEAIIVNDYFRYLVFRYYFERVRPQQACFLWDLHSPAETESHVPFRAAFRRDELWTAAQTACAQQGRVWVIGAATPLPRNWLKLSEGSFLESFSGSEHTVMHYSVYCVTGQPCAGR